MYGQNVINAVYKIKFVGNIYQFKVLFEPM